MIQVVAWTAWGLLGVVCVLALWRWLRRTGEIVAPLPICIGIISLYVLPRAAYLLWFGRAPITSGGLLPAEQTALIGETLALAVLAMLAFLVGHRAPSAETVARRLPFALPDPDPARAVWIAAALGAVGFLALVSLLRDVGGLAYALRHQFELGVLLQGKQAVFQLTRLLIVPTALLLVDPARGRTRWWVWAIALGSAFALFPLGRRAFILLALGFPIVLYHLTVRRIPLRWMLPGSLVLGCLLFSLSFLRLIGTERLGKALQVFVRQPETAVHFAFTATGELKIFDAATIVVRDVPEELPFNYGATFARIPWMLIPRQIWPDKPVTLGEEIVTRYLPRLKTGYPPTAIGEFYTAAGAFAVVLGFFGLGWLGRVGWEWRKRHPGVGNASVYLTFCFFMFDFTRVGDPSRTVWFLLIGAGFFTVAHCVAARTPPRREPLPIIS